MKDKYSFSITLDGIEIITQKTFELNKLEIPKVSIKEFSKVAK